MLTLPSFRYLTSDPRHITVVHKIDVLDGDLLALGDPDNGVYEWAFYRGIECISHSNEGFGSLAAALRAGLNEVLG